MNFKYIEYQNLSSEEIINFLLKKNIEMNNKYNSYFDLSKLKCVDNDNIILLENKINLFCIDKEYDYALNLSNNRNILPNININLTKIDEYYRLYSNNDDENQIKKDIKIINSYIKNLVEFIKLDIIEGLREQNIVFYLFQFINKFFIYIFLNPNIENIKLNNNSQVLENDKLNNNDIDDYIEFFSNFLIIRDSAKLYLSNDIYNTKIKELGEENKIIVIQKLRTNTNLGLYLAFNDFINFPNEFKKLINNCQKFLCHIVRKINNKREIPINNKNNEMIYYKKMNILLEDFIKCFNIFHFINEIYSIIDYKNFYNYELNHNFDIKNEFKLYKKNQSEKEETKNEKDNNLHQDFNINTFKNDLYTLSFTLLSYTWLFDAGTKYILINLFNNHSQNYIALNSFNDLLTEVQEFLNRKNTNNNTILNINSDFCLTLSIRRDYLIQDTLKELSKPNINLRSPLKINFIDEEGIDQGGLKKEFFMLLTRQIFNEKNNLFTYYNKSHLFWFNININSEEEKIKYELIGIILGLSIYNGIILDIKFPLIIYKKLLQIEPSLEDIKEIDIELYNNFMFLLNCEDENLENIIDTNFTVLIEKNGQKMCIPLIEDGENIMINNDNKKEYIDLYIDWFFNISIEDCYSSFEKGFYKVFDEDLSKLLTPEELELIICGSSDLNFQELQKACIYKDGYDKDSITIKFFWEIVFEFNQEEKKKLLSFITGCDRAPINGLGNLTISITKIGTDINKLPSAHTCFNDLLLPDYKDKDLLKKFLLISINYSEGFGLN